MIYKLTPEQEAQIPIYAEKWRQIQLSTKPANRPEVEKVIQQIYSTGGLKPPKSIVWFDSPVAMYSSHYPIEELLRKMTLFATLVFDAERDMDDQIETQLQFSLRTALQSNRVLHISDLIRDAIKNTNRYGGIIFSFNRVPYLDYCRNILNIGPSTQTLDAYLKLCEHINWYLLFDEICLVSERFTELHFDSQDLAHNDSGHAISYPHGWGIYCWHGDVVSQYIITRPQDITPVKIVIEPDPKVASCMVDRYGEDRFNQEGGFKIIQRHRFDGSVPKYYLVRAEEITTDKILSESNIDVLKVLLERYGKENFLRDSGIVISKIEDEYDLYRIEFANGDETITVLRVQQSHFRRDHYLFFPLHARTENDSLIRLLLGEEISQQYPDNNYPYFT